MNDRVQVEYVDAESGETIGVSHLPLARVPDPLELRPSLTLNEERFVVVAADPRHSGEVTARGALRLTVRRVVEGMTRADLEYRVPTLCGSLPSFAREEARGQVLSVPRDGWRQVEVVARSHAEAVAQTLLEIRGVRSQEAREDDRWGELVLRRAFYPAPLPGIELDWLRQRFQDTLDYDAVRLRGLRVGLEGTFGIQLRSGIDLYGARRLNRATCLCLQGRGSGPFLFHDASAIAEVIDVHALVLVDWCRGCLIAPEDLAAYLSD
jgi:hypothetical protein